MRGLLSGRSAFYGRRIVARTQQRADVHERGGVTIREIRNSSHGVAAGDRAALTTMSRVRSILITDFARGAGSRELTAAAKDVRRALDTA